MRRITSVFSALTLAIGFLGLVACGPSQEEKLATAQNETLDALEADKEALDAARAELKGARAALEAALDEGAEDAADQIAELEAKVNELQSTIADQSEAFNGAIVDFINSDPPIEGEPLTETQLAGIRMKSSEDLIVAQEHIDKGGDYRRAIDIYTQALMVDPDNEDVKAALAEAEELRYMSQERFAQVKKGMTEKEVRALLGQPNLRNVRDYPERGVSAWFYPTTEAGDAAAVWFKANKGGAPEVYQIKFEAIVKGEDQEAGA